MSTQMSSRAKVTSVPEPSPADVMYTTTNGEYSGSWHDGTPGTTVPADVPPISEVLAMKALVKKPVRPIQTTAKCILADAIAAEEKARQAEKVLSADVAPKVFPVKAGDMFYPETMKKGAGNPLYSTSAQDIGKEPPKQHQIPDRFFPSTNKFSKLFVDTRPRYTGLNTSQTASKVHSAFDEKY
mmetsp:Transcript_10391/g.18652  ORF Transcript_10391/g.18652 Transcript_10391/m.18652 type:complete len:184 (+) Transcript_10391:86-637(+)